MEFSKIAKILINKGLIKYTIANWTGTIIRISRNDLEKYKDRPELKQSGVYLLLGSEKETDVVYVGQVGVRKRGEGIYSRLQEHKRNSHKVFWSEAIVITTTDNSFGATELAYLEHTFYWMVLKANQYQIKNEIVPASSNITEEKRIELKEFIENVKMLLEIVGYKVFVPNNNTNNQLLYYHEASGRKSGNGLTVFKGSKIAPVDLNNCHRSVKGNRRKYASKVKNGVLIEDITFPSVSAASTFVAGFNTNGYISWKDSNGKKLRYLA